MRGVYGEYSRPVCISAGTRVKEEVDKVVLWNSNYELDN